MKDFRVGYIFRDMGAVNDIDGVIKCDSRNIANADNVCLKATAASVTVSVRAEQSASGSAAACLTTTKAIADSGACESLTYRSTVYTIFIS